MATLQELEHAFVLADDAGNKEDAAAFAAEIAKMRSAPRVPEVGGEGRMNFPLSAQVGLNAPADAYNPRDPLQKAIDRSNAQTFDAAMGTELPMVASMGGPITGSPAGAAGEYLVQLRRKMAGEQPDIKWGEVTKQAIINAIPLAKARGVIPVLKNAGRMGAGGAFAEAERSAIDDKKLPSAGDTAMAAGVPAGIAAAIPFIGKLVAKALGRADPADIAKMAALKSQNKTEDATLEAIRARGGVVAPSQINDSSYNKFLESVAGPTNVENGGSKINAKVFNEIAREEAGVPVNVAMDPQALRAARENIAAPAYAELKKLGLGDQLNQWREANNLAQKYNKELAGNYTVAVEQVRDAKVAEADAILASIKAEAVKKGRPDVADALEESRVKFAKNYDVTEATNGGNSDVNARVLASMLRARGDGGLTGGLGDIARFQEAFPDFAKPKAGMPGSPSAVTAGTGLLAVSSASGAPVKEVMVGGLPFLRGAIRDHILSPEYQAKHLKRDYTPPANADLAAIQALIRAAVVAERSKRKDDQK